MAASPLMRTKAEWIDRRRTGVSALGSDPALPIYVITLAVFIAACAFSSTFRRPYNLSNIAIQTVAIALASMGQTFAILAGDVDLCVGGVISLTTIACATMMQDSVVHMAAAIATSFIIGVSVGILNGLLVSKIKMDAMVITFATNSALMGLALHLMPVPGGMVPYKYMTLIDLPVLGIPLPVVLVIALAVVSYYVLNRTVLGVHIRAVGADTPAAFRSGINTTVTKVRAHVIAGLFAATAGLFLAARMGSGDALAGAPFSLDSMTAVIAGGTNFATGVGDVTGTVIAALLITMLGNLLNHLGVSTYVQYVFKGLLLIVAVAGGAIRRKTRSGIGE